MVLLTNIRYVSNPCQSKLSYIPKHPRWKFREVECEECKSKFCLDVNLSAGRGGRFWRCQLSPTTILPHTRGLLTPPPPPPPHTPPPAPPPPAAPPPPVSVSPLQQCSWPSTLAWYWYCPLFVSVLVLVWECLEGQCNVGPNALAYLTVSTQVVFRHRALTQDEDGKQRGPTKSDIFWPNLTFETSCMKEMNQIKRVAPLI